MCTLVPCYLFGNTQLLSLAYGHSSVKDLSRKLGFALITFWGRCFLPLPYRLPVLGVMGTPIQVEKNLNPSDELVEKYQEQLISSMMELFDKYKVHYGWENKTLVVK